MVLVGNLSSFTVITRTPVAWAFDNKCNGKMMKERKELSQAESARPSLLFLSVSSSAVALSVHRNLLHATVPSFLYNYAGGAVVCLGALHHHRTALLVSLRMFKVVAFLSLPIHRLPSVHFLVTMLSTYNDLVSSYPINQLKGKASLSCNEIELLGG
uniref:Uncharacterized protein TCIL3000_10_1200 n=1 Tax=Trypanosoma congolense (strain IL3000) TaxID=1068625 RepID=G0UVE6_TRYCI|nr:unnamed protein product [Trypanosoma congolense IL3000]